MKNEETNTGQAILKAAEELFLEQGFEQTTTKQIAQRAGCNQALLHYYYRTKDNLFVQIFEEKAKFIATHFLDINSTAQTLEERISQMVELHFELFRKNPRLVPFLLKEVLSDPVRVAPILDKIKQYMVKIFVRMICTTLSMNISGTTTSMRRVLCSYQMSVLQWRTTSPTSLRSNTLVWITSTHPIRNSPITSPISPMLISLLGISRNSSTSRIS